MTRKPPSGWAPPSQCPESRDASPERIALLERLEARFRRYDSDHDDIHWDILLRDMRCILRDIDALAAGEDAAGKKEEE